MASARRITVEFIGNDRSLGKTAQGIERKTSSLGSKLKSFGKVAALGLAAGAAVAGKALYDMGQEAGDLGETVSKVNAIFGSKAGKGLETWAGNAASSLGQSKQVALDAAATFGTFGKAAGKSGEDLAKFARENTQLATDLASFNNTSPEEAIQALGAAFRGEAEPIRSFGVLLDDATLRNEALQMGLIKTTKDALTPQQKVLAAQTAIMKQTSDAQGDFARTSGGLAGQQKILKAQFENLRTEIGTQVLPAMTRLASWANSSLIPAMKSLAAWVTREVVPGLRKLGAIIQAHVMPKVIALAKWVRGDLIPVLSKTANDIMPSLRRSFALVSKTVKENEGSLKAVGSFITKTLIPVIGKIAKVALPFMATQFALVVKISRFVVGAFRSVDAAGQRLGESFSRLGRAARAAVETVVGVFRGLSNGVQAALGGLYGMLKNIGLQAMQGLVHGVLSLKNYLLGIVANIALSVATKMKNALRIKSPSLVMKGIGVHIMEGLVGGIESKRVALAKVLERVTGFVKAQADNLKGLISDRNSFAAGFQSFAPSVFGADMTDPTSGASTASVGSILAFQREQEAKAKSLQASVRRLVKMGLSKSLIQQMAASGESGAAQIHALASGSAADVKELNRLAQGTSSALNSAGMAAGNAIYGGRISASREDIGSARNIAHFLEKLDRRLEKDQTIELRLDGKTLLTWLRKHKRQTGANLGLA